MKKSSFNRGMSKLRSKGFSKQKAYARMKALAWANRTNARSGQTKKSRASAKRGLSKVAKPRISYQVYLKRYSLPGLSDNRASYERFLKAGGPRS
jgi:hypothetical protein